MSCAAAFLALTAPAEFQEMVVFEEEELACLQGQLLCKAKLA